MLRATCLAIATAMLASLSAGSASAADEATTINDLVGGAKLIARTRVSHVDYRNSTSGLRGANPVPYTFVTYQLIRVVRGTPTSATLRVRYLGGPDGRGHIVEPSEVPIFQVGDEDILFFQGNGEAGCPLVSCVQGRYRILNEAVYDGTGAPVRAIQDGRVIASGAMPSAFATVSYPAPSFDELIKSPEALETLRRRGLSIEDARRSYEAQAPKRVVLRTSQMAAASADSPAGSAGQQRQAAAQPLSVERFLETIGQARASAGGRAAGVRSIEVGTPAGPSVAANAPAPSSGRSLTTPPRTPADIAEENALPKDDPTIGRNKSR